MNDSNDSEIFEVPFDPVLPAVRTEQAVIEAKPATTAGPNNALDRERTRKGTMNEQTAVAKTTAQDREVMFRAYGSDETVRLNITMIRRFFANPTKSGAVATDEDCIKYMMLCRARRMNPFEGDAFLVGYDSQKGPVFSMITAHQVFLKRAESCPEFDGMESGAIVREGESVKDVQGDFLVDGQELLGAWAKVYRKDRRIPFSSRLNFNRRAKGNEFWSRDPAGMIVKCAEADALRQAFPTSLAGLQSHEERIIDISPPPMPEARKLPALAAVDRGEELPPPPPNTQSVATIAPPVEPPVAAPVPPQGEQPSIKDELADIITGAGFTFDDLQSWATEAGHFERPYDDFSQIPQVTAKRLVKAQVGLLKELAKRKAGQ